MKNKNNILAVIGIWIVLIPFLGFPGSWKNIIIIVSGLIIAGISYFLNTSEVSQNDRKSKNDSFSNPENINLYDKEIQ